MKESLHHIEQQDVFLYNPMLSAFDTRRGGGEPNAYVDFQHGVARFPLEYFPNVGSINYGGPWKEGPWALKGDLSIEMKIRGVDLGLGCGFGSRIVYNGPFVMGFMSDVYNYAYCTSDGVEYTHSATGSLSVNEWYHIVVTRSSTDPYPVNFYVNGYLSGEADQESGTSLPTSDADLLVVDPNFGWLGDMEFITFYNKILSADECYNLYM